MKKISEIILKKLTELEESPKTLFSFTEKGQYARSEIKYKKTRFIHFDNGLYIWDLNFSGNGRRYIPVKAELEISKDFSDWIKKFKKTTKEQLVAQLLEEDRDVLQMRCERDGEENWQKSEDAIKKELFRCFKKLQ